jgi:hypothetical protein
VNLYFKDKVLLFWKRGKLGQTLYVHWPNWFVGTHPNLPQLIIIWEEYQTFWRYKMMCARLLNYAISFEKFYHIPLISL